jgi:hypothetical protein
VVGIIGFVVSVAYTFWWPPRAPGPTRSA